MARLNDLNHLTDVYMECLIPVNNLRVSILRPHPNFPEPNLKAIVLEFIKVEEKHRRKGIARRFRRCRRSGCSGRALGEGLAPLGLGVRSSYNGLLLAEV